jgi:uncharacterized surface protein with fasciclin (FAS1) repeats
MKMARTLALSISFLTALGMGLPAFANNAALETGLQKSVDLSMFYQALVTTGVINEFQEGKHYTVFAPINTAFQAIDPAQYPCFYAVECRPQIAALLNNHVASGDHALKEMVTYGNGFPSIGDAAIKIEEPYVGDYTADGHQILSKTEIDGNVIYRIDGVLAQQKDLTQFQMASLALPDSAVAEQETVTTFETPLTNSGGATTTTTIVQHATIGPQN